MSHIETPEAAKERFEREYAELVLSDPTDAPLSQSILLAHAAWHVEQGYFHLPDALHKLRAAVQVDESLLVYLDDLAREVGMVYGGSFVAGRDLPEAWVAEVTTALRRMASELRAGVGDVE